MFDSTTTLWAIQPPVPCHPGIVRHRLLLISGSQVKANIGCPHQQDQCHYCPSTSCRRERLLVENFVDMEREIWPPSPVK